MSLRTQPRTEHRAVLRANRRTVLRWMGVQVALPLLSTVLPSRARAEGTPLRRRFIGAFFPNGAYMPAGADGSWNFSEALSPLVDAGVQNNTIIVRGVFNNVSGVDPHWQNTAGFLSCRPIVLGDAAVARCGKTLDQVVADQTPMAIRSLEVGAPYYHVHPLNDHPGYSNDYLNRISWQTDDTFRAPIADPRQMFEKVFGVTSGSAAQIRHLHATKQSVLDFIHKDATRLAARLPSAYRPVLETYMETVREVELSLDNAGLGSSCAAQPEEPTGDFGDFQARYLERYQLMHRMVAVAMQCGLTNVATVMYGPSSSDLHFAEALGAGTGHHGCAHNQGQQPLIERLKRMNLLQMGLVADLLKNLRDLGLLDETLVLVGSDMSDGDIHHTENIPTLLCGGGADLKFGQVVGDRTQRRPLSDLHLDILRLLGVDSITTWGEGEIQSTGVPVPLRV